VSEKASAERCSLGLFLFCSTLLGAGLLIYSQTGAFAWDEGFHLLAAKLVKIGRRPYLDFVHAQAPLNAYWNAMLMRVFGESWRPIHAVDALLATGAVTMAAAFVRSRFPSAGVGRNGEAVMLQDPRLQGWGAAVVVAVFVLAGLNVDFITFGPIAQAYPFAVFLIVAAFFLTVRSVAEESAWLGALAGLLSGLAAESTLLTAIVAPVLLLWIALYTARERRTLHAAAFVGGAVVAFVPLLLLFVQSPRRVVFGVLQYHMFYRRSEWPGATQHDLELLTSWINSPQALILAALALAGVWFVAKKSGWDRARRGEFYLAGWIALALCLYLSTPHPTFVQYFMLPVPFLAILASLGLFGIAQQWSAGWPVCRRIPLWPVAVVGTILALGLARDLYDNRDDFSWPKMEQVAQKVNEVTAPGAPVYLDEMTYFLTGRIPPAGNEYESSHKLTLAPEFAQYVHIIPQAEFDRRIAGGEFATIESCDEADWYQDRMLEQLYRQKAEINDCYVFWDRAPKH
jgi:hypothetical protein